MKNIELINKVSTGSENGGAGEVFSAAVLNL